MGSHMVACAAGMAHYEVALQCRQVFGVNRDIAQRAESGSDAVEWLSCPLDFLVEKFAAIFDERGAFGAQHDFRA